MVRTNGKKKKVEVTFKSNCMTMAELTWWDSERCFKVINRKILEH